MEEIHNEGREWGSFNPAAQCPMPNLFLEGSALSGYFLCYMCRKQIIAIRFANITNPQQTANLSYGVCPPLLIHITPLSPSLSLCTRLAGTYLSWPCVVNTSYVPPVPNSNLHVLSLPLDSLIFDFFFILIYLH